MGPNTQPEGIAIVGIAGRFPKAENIEAFWNNVRHARECITFFRPDELDVSGIEFPRHKPEFVQARGMLEGADLFDAAFFGMSPKEAEVTDPQQRLFLECAWAALEDAGCDPQREERLIGVFGSSSMNTYLITHLLSRPELLDTIGAYQLMLTNDKDFLATRVAYKLNLRGPALTVQTACSTGLVTICVACQNLLTLQCDIALAGSVSVTFPQRHNHLFQEGGIASPDGRCRAFDSKADGTAPGEGVGVVVLKRLSDALADGDHIYAVIKGFAMNNDGASKIGYAAPSEMGQAEAIAWAQAMAGFDPSTIGYLEAHGTGTALGDPIEIAGLTRAFRAATDARQFCAIGSVKTCIGHLDVAAGIAGLINATLALHHKTLPPSLNFETPNPKIDFANSPFYVNTRATEWRSNGAPRRAGVSSFGIGGTNAHVVLEEAPAQDAPAGSRPAHLLLLSAKTQAALDRATANLSKHLDRHPELNLADVACTLQLGRREFPFRRAIVASGREEAVALLNRPDPRRVFTNEAQQRSVSVAFLFPGQGAQRVNMGRELYEHEPVFRQHVDFCADTLEAHLGLDLRSVLYPQENESASREQLRQTRLTQPALFTIEYALAQLWMSWGIRPAAMIGHSIGEYVAACLAGVFSIEEALRIVAERARLMQATAPGSMLAVRLPEDEALPVLNGAVSLAAINGESQCVLAGSTEAISAIQQKLESRGVACHRLDTSHAFHSPMIEPACEAFAEAVSRASLNAPRIPFISNVTGDWITAREATSPAYWARHMRQTVRFATGIARLLTNPDLLFMECGPGQVLSTLTRQHPSARAPHVVVPSLATTPGQTDSCGILTALGRLWLAGASVDWKAFYKHEQRRRVPLPTYPFERKRFFVDPVPVTLAPRAKTAERNGSANGFLHDDSHSDAPEAEAGNAPPRKEPVTIESQLRDLFSQLSGINLTHVNGGVTFLEMGLDSLMLTQASQAIEKRFGVKIPFGQLMARLSTLDALAGHLQKTQSTRGEAQDSAPLASNRLSRNPLAPNVASQVSETNP